MTRKLRFYLNPTLEPKNDKITPDVKLEIPVGQYLFELKKKFEMLF